MWENLDFYFPNKKKIFWTTEYIENKVYLALLDGAGMGLNPHSVTRVWYNTVNNNIALTNLFNTSFILNTFV